MQNTAHTDSHHVREEPQLPLQLPTHPVKRFVRIQLGLLLACWRPARLRELKDHFKLEGLSKADRWMLSAVVHRAHLRGESDWANRIHKAFWQSSAAAHWMGGDARYREMFLVHHIGIVAPLVASARATQARQLFEIGCGRGDVLWHLAREMPWLEQLTGLDLNTAMLDEARQHTQDPRITFVAGDASDHLKTHAADQCIVLTNGGVYEYWTQAQLRQHFAHLATLHAVTVALVEPIDAKHDFATMPDSMPYGWESSLSHNYPALLREAGFSVHYEQRVMPDGAPYPWYLLVANTAYA